MKDRIFDVLKAIVHSYHWRNLKDRIVTDLLKLSSEIPELLSVSDSDHALSFDSDSDEESAIEPSSGSTKTHTFSRGRSSESTGASLLDKLTEFVAKDVVEARQLTEHLRKNISSIVVSDGVPPFLIFFPVNAGHKIFRQY